jgi:23S rRNA pseudouridine1911/1915/1917 synthase
MDPETIDLLLPARLCGQRLDKALAAVLTRYSRNRIQTWITQARVQVNQAIETKVSRQVSAGDHLRLLPLPTEEVGAFQPEAIELDVVYADRAVLVLNKPVGLVVHPAAGHWGGTLMNALLHHYPELSQLPRAGIVHRLDKDTSGLMVVARTLAAQADLLCQLRARSVKRSYCALVLGKTPEYGTIDAAVGRDPYARTKMAVVEHGREARTHFWRLAYAESGKVGISWLRCELDTGRTHQIRVHLASLRHPLVGDRVYGKNSAALSFPRQALHAEGLGLLHPEDGRSRDWHASPPSDMLALIASLGFG